MTSRACGKPEVYINRQWLVIERSAELCVSDSSIYIDNLIWKGWCVHSWLVQGSLFVYQVDERHVGSN